MEGIMRWLSRLFFLERFSWPTRFLSWPLTLFKSQEGVLYQAELEYLKERLQEQLQETVFCNIRKSGQVTLCTASETIASIKLYPKARRKRSIYVVVSLNDEYEMYKVWFELTFINYKMSFRKPILTLHSSWKIPSRGQ